MCGNLVDNLPPETVDILLTGLGDVVGDGNRLGIAAQEVSFSISLLRSVNRTSIEHQYRRVLGGLAPLTKYDFFGGGRVQKVGHCLPSRLHDYVSIS